jgi:hypothetical protein
MKGGGIGALAAESWQRRQRNGVYQWHENNEKQLMK